MKTFEIPPLTSSVILKFTCPCGEEIVTDEFGVPSANYSEDTHEKSLVTEEYDVECPECGQVFTVVIGQSVCGCEGWIDELDDDEDVEITATSE
ncbi:MAG: hypothetical protein K2F69_08070 [Bacteroidaceae bacterium]|nr:hypothetical protein [Bacteroidaceae bacterium]